MSMRPPTSPAVSVIGIVTELGDAEERNLRVRRYSVKKRIGFVTATVLVTVLVTLLIGEILVRIFDPVVTLRPRWRYSPKYGHRHHENVTMVHEGPGGWRFTYEINRYGYRGPAVSVSNAYDTDNIVILGDSNAFGFGVNEGEQFSSVLARQLGDGYRVINIAVGGYALTQEIRSFYEFGQLYLPTVVILQFSDNDPEDNFYSRVTDIENGKFVFRDVYRPAGWLRDYLSKSIVQKSHLYNNFRYRIFTFFREKYIKRAFAKADDSSSERIKVSQDEFYSSLLEVFSKDLRTRGIRLIMIASHGSALDGFQKIRSTIVELESSGDLDYVEIDDWLDGPDSYPPSPEGHGWGTEAHRRLGSAMAEYITKTLSE